MPVTLVATASEEEIIGLIDQWTSLLEQERYEDAHALLEAGPDWSAALVKEVIQAYGDEAASQVTLLNNGTGLDGAGNLAPARQRKAVDWYSEDQGEVWYDLNLNGLVSDLTATFNLEKRNGRVHVMLQDVHVM